MSTTVPAYRPTLADVAALIRARTKDSNGQELGTFTTATRPTDAQAQEAIDHAVIALHEKVGPIGEHCAETARLCAAYGAAAEIELSYFPEQARTDRSPYNFLIARWTASLEGVRECVLGNLPGTGVGGAPAGVRLGTLVAYSDTAHGFYTGEIGVLGSKPPEPEPPITEGEHDMPPVVAHVAVAGKTAWRTLALPSGCTVAYVKASEGPVFVHGIKLATAPVDGQLLKLGYDWALSDFAAGQYTKPAAEQIYLGAPEMPEATRKELETGLGAPPFSEPEAGTAFTTRGGFSELFSTGMLNLVWRADLQRWVAPALAGEK